MQPTARAVRPFFHCLSSRPIASTSTSCVHLNPLSASPFSSIHTSQLNRNLPLCSSFSTQTQVPSTSSSPQPPPSSKPRRRPPRPPPLQVTPSAAARIQYLLSKSPASPAPLGVRIGLRTRGCNGMAYVLNYISEPPKFDERVNIGENVAVFIDPRALMHIVGTTMDFVDNDLVSEFVFQNPNAKGTCGCGESFNV